MTSAFVLLHGFTGCPRSWRRLAERLEPEAEVLAPALLGHDGSAGPSSIISFEQEVDRIGAVLCAANTRRAHLVGYSLGARVGLGLLLRHAELFEKATLIGVHPGLDNEPERAERRKSDERWCELIETRGLQAFVEVWQEQPLFSTQKHLPEELLDEQRRERMSHDPAGLARSLRSVGLGRMPGYSGRLAELECPVTLVVGQLDHKFGALAVQMASCCPVARLVVVERAGHNVLMERPDSLHELLQPASGKSHVPSSTRASHIQQGRDT